MTHPIIKTDKYILITSDEEIKIEDTTINLKSTHNHKELCTIDNDIELERYAKKQGNDCKKVIAHLPLNNSPILEGVPLLPPLPNDEDDIDKLAEKEITFVEGSSDIKGMIISAERGGFVKGFSKAKEKYNITSDKILDLYIEETGYGMDMWSKEENATMLVIAKIIDSLSQPKLPVGFRCETISLKQLPFNVEMSVDEINKPKIFKGVMQGEWIFE